MAVVRDASLFVTALWCFWNAPRILGYDYRLSRLDTLIGAGLITASILLSA